MFVQTAPSIAPKLEPSEDDIMEFLRQNAAESPKDYEALDRNSLESELLSLRKTRVAALRRQQKVLLQKVDSGMDLYAFGLEFQRNSMELCHTELELANTQQERIACLQSTLKTVVYLEKLALNRLQSGITDEAYFLLAVTNRQRIEIELIRELLETQVAK